MNLTTNYVISTRTTYSLKEQFDELVKVALAEKQLLEESNKEKISPDVMNGSAKSPNFFLNNKPLKRSERNPQQQEVKQEIFFETFHTWELIKKIFTNETSYLISICF